MQYLYIVWVLNVTTGAQTTVPDAIMKTPEACLQLAHVVGDELAIDASEGRINKDHSYEVFCKKVSSK